MSPHPPMICDFCSATPVRWLYDCATFDMPQGVQSQGAWATCDTCADIIERRDKTALANRLPKQKEFRIPAIRAAQLQFRAEFWKHMLGTRTAVGEQARPADSPVEQTIQPFVPVVSKDRPWMDAHEMRERALTAVRLELSRLTTVTELDVRLDISYQALQKEVLTRCPVYDWSAETMNAALLASRTVPMESVLTREMFPGPSGWWWFRQPIQDASNGPPNVALLWHAPLATESAMFMVYDLTQNRVPVGNLGWVWGMGQSLNEMMAEKKLQADRPSSLPTVAQMSRFFLAATAWIQQRIVTMRAEPIDRHSRKRFAREYRVPPPMDVQIIELRRRESAPHHADTSSAVEWSCQWVVSGHWTHQVHGKKRGERRLQYILPYVKGPSDKPLRVPKQTVYVVDR